MSRSCRSLYFKRVQSVFDGKSVDKQHRHSFLFRKHLKCAFCHGTLIAEIQRGHIYYRCQAKACPQKTIREEVVETSFTDVLKLLRFDDDEMSYFRTEIEQSYRNEHERVETYAKNLRLQHEQTKDRLSKLTDAYIDGVLDKNMYIEKKNSLLVEEQMVREQLLDVGQSESLVLKKVEGSIEQANNAYLSYKEGLFEDRRDMVKTTTSNIIVKDKIVLIELHYPFQLIAERQKVICGSPHRDVPRTLSALLSQLCEYFKKNELKYQQLY